MLGEMGPRAKSALPALVSALQDDTLRDSVVDALVKIGEGAVKALDAALDNANPQVRLGAALALGRIGPNARPAIRSLNYVSRTDKVPAVRQAAEEALAKIQGKR